MRPTSSSESPTRTPEKLNTTSAEADAMMMGFEFFDEKGHLNPRKILFTEKTCPNKTQRVLSSLFGKIMKWNARRWAENFLENTRINHPSANQKIKEQVGSLLQDIRKEGFVRMSQLFNVVASATTEAKLPNEDGDQNTSVQTGNRFIPASTPFLINHDEIVQDFQTQNFSNNQEKISSTQINPNDTEPDKSDLFEACQIIEDQWNDLSGIFDDEYVPKQYRLPVKSGFLDYCKGNRIKISLDQTLSNEAFIHLDENEWSKYKKIFTPAQHAAWTKKRAEWIAHCEGEKNGSLTNTKTRREPDLRLQLKTEKSIVRAETELSVYEAFSKYANEFNQLSHGNLPLPRPAQDIIDSGFLLYCELGTAALEHINIHTLEEFLIEYKTKWYVFKNILADSQFDQLIKYSDTIAQDLASYRKNNPSSIEESITEINQEINRPPIEEDNLVRIRGNPIGLFSDKTIVTFDHLQLIQWDDDDLPDQVSLADAKKLDDYFSSAELNEDNKSICKKISALTEKMLHIPAYRHSLIENKNAPPTQNAVDVLKNIYGRYLMRYAAGKSNKKTVPATAKSLSKNRFQKKSKPQSKKKIKFVSTNKSVKEMQAKHDLDGKNSNDDKKLTQEMRDQIKEANDLIDRISKKL